MKRNWDVVREILFTLEDLKPTEALSLNGFDESRHYDISYHVKMLGDAGLLVVEFFHELSEQPSNFYATELTWAGHEFLDSVREKNTWDKVKALIKEKGGVMTFDVIKTTATTVASTLIKASIS
ncbi:hypothetical protein CXF78_09940 (plasmid) [Shewanella sp. 11B5]|uniref:DUF2513 domain-containing protein n=1 Tax=Shewanella sp. 11B5 TaxID=2058298 RepID=UPI000C7A03F1|nr:DUF2513 domain-containing protein [Shewanella sp. 11B5]PKI04907.1 hypothetical protein CXF78_09940 [Shewanella sp. 11B5]